MDQLDLASVEALSSGEEQAVYRCRLKPSESSDKTAAHLRAIITVHVPSRTVDSLELRSVSEFSPTLAVKVNELRTILTYSRPGDDRPALPLKVETRQRGTAFWFKSLDAEMTVTFSHYERAGKR